MQETSAEPNIGGPVAQAMERNKIAELLARDSQASATEPAIANLVLQNGQPIASVSASEQLMQLVQKNLTGPALVFPATLVKGMLRERKGGPFALIAPVVKEAYMPPWCPPFQVGPLSHETPETPHRHSLQDELYLVFEGRICIHCRLGRKSARYVGDPGTAILVPRGTTHKVEWLEPGWAYTIKAPHVFGEAAKQVVQ